MIIGAGRQRVVVAGSNHDESELEDQYGILVIIYIIQIREGLTIKHSKIIFLKIDFKRFFQSNLFHKLIFFKNYFECLPDTLTFSKMTLEKLNQTYSKSSLL